MSNNDKLEQYHAAYAATQAARKELLAATKAAWPVGMPVISNKFSTGPIACTVAGHCEWDNDVGSLRLRNNRTRGWLPAVPPIAKAPEPAKRVAWLTHEQAETLLAELPPHLAVMARFALATGLRESNIRLLRWQQVDRQRAVAWFEADEMKAGRTHSVPLNEPALRVLAAQHDQHRTWVFPVPRWAETSAKGEDPHQVADAPTGKISSAAWRKACTRAGLPWLRFHDLRHTWASWHVQGGTPLPVLQELGGWASLAMVQRYAHLGVSHVAAWAGNLSGGTNPAQPAHQPAMKNGPEGPLSEGKNLGWLMGLEPTTTGITRRSAIQDASKIKHLRAVKKPKAA